MKSSKSLTHGFKRNAILAAAALFVTGASASQASVSSLYSFPQTGASWPNARPIVGVDGKMYGTTTDGGTSGQGTVYSADTSGKITILHSFDILSGGNPNAGVVQGQDGSLYGTAANGGDYNYGVIFKISPTGQYSVLHSFNSTDGASPYSTLAFGSDGNLYGMTQSGGGNGAGVYFRISTSGIYTLLGSLDCTTVGCYPIEGFTLNSDGALYTTIKEGGSNGDGTAVKLTTDGTLTLLHTFGTNDGITPSGGLTIGADGLLYGVTTRGAGKGERNGTVFSMTTDGTVKVIARFNRKSSTSRPVGHLLLANDGNLYGLTSGQTQTDTGEASNGSIFRINSKGKLTTIGYFPDLDANNVPMRTPNYGLAQANDGNLYGVQPLGGTTQDGLLFKSTLSGTVTVVNSLGYYPAGYGPSGVLTVGADNALYGATSLGGAVQNAGWGTVYRIGLDGSESTLYSFDSTHGAMPIGELLLAKDGNFYGLYTRSSANANGGVYKISPTGQYTQVADFGGTINSGPSSGVIQGSDGAFYGTTCANGIASFGTVFKVDANGTVSVVGDMQTPTMGDCPNTKLTLASDGNYYSTTAAGGASNYGTIFEYNPSTGISVAASFDGTLLGKTPSADLKVGSDGALYGTTTQGGILNEGTFFRFDVTTRALTVLTSFDGLSIGGFPNGQLTTDGAGGFYTTVSSGGDSAYGGVVHLSLDGTAQMVYSWSSGLNESNANGLTLAPNGVYYGSAYFHGTAGAGSIFTFTPDVALNAKKAPVSASRKK